jgi:hypothetical protein
VLLGPDIEWNLSVTLDNSIALPNTAYTVTGTTKEFPAYELYIFDGQQPVTVLQYTPGNPTCSTSMYQQPNISVPDYCLEPYGILITQTVGPFLGTLP